MPPREAPRKNYCMTIFHDKEADPRTKYDGETMAYLIVGNETCPDTGRKHYQCYVQYIKKVRFTQVKKDFGNSTHIEASRGTDQQNYEYCIKEGDFTEFGTRNNTSGVRSDLLSAVDASKTMTFDELAVDEVHAATVARHMQYFRHIYNARSRMEGIESLRAQFADFQPRGWQNGLLAVTAAEPDSRKFHWYWDAVGNTGKSYMASYLVACKNAAVFTGGKMADIAMAYNNEPIVIFDLSRTQAEHMDYIYSIIEGFKNGRLFSPKYESIVKIFKVPHVFVFANFVPTPEQQAEKLSRDRWVVHEVCSRVAV
uniref:Replication-associated protein n=1 Tax=Circoviridae sp. TaxID=1954248 RepID=A0A890UZJ2_9VIRU|nr:MAG: replication-associated protein [Circoviridae sp.]